MCLLSCCCVVFLIVGFSIFRFCSLDVVLFLFCAWMLFLYVVARLWCWLMVFVCGVLFQTSIF